MLTCGLMAYMATSTRSDSLCFVVAYVISETIILDDRLQHTDMTKMLLRRVSLALEIVALKIANQEWKHNSVLF